MSAAVTARIASDLLAMLAKRTVHRITKKRRQVPGFGVNQRIHREWRGREEQDRPGRLPIDLSSHQKQRQYSEYEGQLAMVKPVGVEPDLSGQRSRAKSFGRNATLAPSSQ